MLNKRRRTKVEMTSQLQYTKLRLKVCRKICKHPNSINWTLVVAAHIILCRGQVNPSPIVELSKASTIAVQAHRQKKPLSRGIHSSIKFLLCRPSIILLPWSETTSSSRELIRAKFRTVLTMECKSTTTVFTKTTALIKVSTVWCSPQVLSTYLNATTN
jgi:hypothetical protein